ncbi:MAG: nuclear transport factor 2 family protein [Thermoanaerobaculia bacterium]|nr:nuclear transport factor 2 family protein [Thermoanaerobaculia bacterium]
MNHNAVFLLLLLPVFGAAQTQPAPAAGHIPKIHIPPRAENTAWLKEINRDIWAPFAEAYAAGDAEKYLGLHTPDFIRASGGDRAEVKDLAAYRESVTRGFQWGRDNNRRAAIAFRFFERVAGEKLASERGIYRYTSIAPDGGQQHFYGKFHVFHRKVDGVWKIAVDYDSNEDNTIGVADFEAGLPPHRFGCMAEAIALDDSLGRIRNHACETVSLSQSIRQYAAAIAAIDFSGCPEPFSAGFKKHAAAWLALLPVTNQYSDLRGEMHTLFKQLESGRHAEQFKPLLKSVWDTWGEIEEAMK